MKKNKTLVTAHTGKSDVDCRFLAKAGARMGAAGCPQFPLVVGGSGMTGSNMIVLLANAPGCKRVRVLDRVPPRSSVLDDSPELKEKLDFVQHRLGVDSNEDLKKALEGCDCLFSIITPDVQKATVEQFHQTNVDGIRLLLEAAKATNIAKFVFMSSIAVTNHFEDSVNMSEADGLPPLETLTSPYDITKRMGEDLVLRADDPNGMRTCAVRPGGILLSPKDYFFRNYFMIPGLLFGIARVSTLDFIAGQDVTRGMLLAAKAMHCRPGETCGQSFFLTKGGSHPPYDLMYAMSEFLGWPTYNLPEWMFEAGCHAQHFFFIVKTFLGFEMPGIPPHKFWKLARIEQTFDNSKAERVLGYKAEVSMREAVWHICACHVRDLEKGCIPQYGLWLFYFTKPLFWLCLFLMLVLGSFCRMAVGPAMLLDDL